MMDVSGIILFPYMELEKTLASIQETASKIAFKIGLLECTNEWIGDEG